MAICKDSLVKRERTHVQRAAGVVADRDVRAAAVGPHDKDR